MAVPIETGRYRVGDEPAPGYRLIEFLGRGEFGHVWKAASPGGIEVALKIIDLSRAGGSKELRAVRLIKLKRIRHPNLCPVIAFWLKDAGGNILHDTDEAITRLAGGDVGGGDDATLQPNGAAESGLGTDGPVPSRLLSETLDVSDLDTDRTWPPTEATSTPESTPEATPEPTPEAAEAALEDDCAVELLIAMGLGDGTLADRLKTCQAAGSEGIPIDELLDYFEAAANAIDCLNQKHRIQHGDIKPSNILTVGGAAQVCDFGLAKMIGDMRKTSTALTLAYGSPEVFDGKPPSPTSDQYSLAISYAELRNGRLPFASEEPTWTEICRAKLQGELDLSALPLAEQEALQCGTAFCPDDRFSTCLEMVTALRDAQRPPPSPPSRIGRLTQLTGLVLVAALCAGLLAKWWWIDGPTNPWEELNQNLGKGQFQLATSLLGHFSHDDRLQAKERIRTAWHTLAEDLSKQGKWDEAWRQQSGFLELFPDNPGTLRDITRDAWRRVAAGTQADLTAAQQRFDFAQSFVQSHTESLHDSDASQIDAAAQLGLLGIAARRGEWSEVQNQREVVKRNLSVAGRPARVHGDVLRILLEYDPEATGREGVLPEANAADAARFLADLTDSWQLPVFSLAALQQHLDPWEQAQVLELRALAFDELSPHFTSLNPADQQRAQQLWPGGFETWQVKSLLRQAESQLAEDDFTGCQDVLDRAAKVVVEDPALRAQIESMKTLVKFRDPRVAATPAWQQFEQYAKTAIGPRVPEVAMTLAGWVDRNPTYADRAERTLQSVRQRSEATAKGRAELEAAALHVMAVRLICLPAPAPDDVTEFLRRSAERDLQGTPDPVVDACRAECLVGALAEETQSDAWREADRSVGEAVERLQQGADSPYADYVWFVAALVKAKDPTRADVQAAAEALGRAFPSGARSAACDLPRRRDAGVTILVQAARELRQADDDTIVQVAFSADSAERAFVFLELARGLTTSPPPELLTSLALAAFCSSPPDLAQATSVAEEQIARGTSTGQLLLVSALANAQRFEQENEPAARAIALRRFGQLLDRWWATGQNAPQETQKAVYQRIVTPALRLAESASSELAGSDSAELGPSLATLFATQGRLIEQNYDLRKEYGPDTIYTAFGKAIAYLPRADYCVGRGRALIGREGIDPATKLNELKALAEQALRLESGCRGAHGLMGYALVLQSRTKAKSDDRRRDLQQAIQHYRAAIPAPGQQRDADVAVYLVGRSTAHVESAFLIDAIPAKRKQLDLAATDAEQATSIASRRHPEYAWNAWGNALEDIAYYCRQTDAFNDADEKFTQAIRSAFSRGISTAASLLNRGRARFRQARFGGLPALAQTQKLDAARTDLLAALEQHESNQTSNPQEHAEIDVWLAQVYKTTAYQTQPGGDNRQLIEHLGQANDYVAAAAKLAKDHDVLNWPEYQVQSAELALIRSLVGDAAAADWRQRARQRVALFRAAKLAHARRPDYQLRSMVVDILAVGTGAPRRRLIDQYRAEFPLSEAASRPYNVQLLLLRGEDVVAAMQDSRPLADGDKAASDAQEAVRQAAEMGASPWADSFRARAAGVLGIVRLATYYEHQKTADLLQACVELRKAVQASTQFDAPQPLSDVVAWHLASRHHEYQVWMAWANYKLLTLPQSRLSPAQRETVDRQRAQLKAEGRQAAAASKIAELVQIYDRL